jgi:branched-chain amino acid transport system permease protein
MSALAQRRPGVTAFAALTLGGLLALAVAGTLTRYQVTVWFTLSTYMVLAQGWNIMAGYSGSISLGVGTAVGVGGYTAGLLMIHRGWGPVTAIVAGGVASATLGAALSLPLLRLRGFYFAVGTLAATLTLQALVVNWEFAGGSSGLNVPIDRVPDDLTMLRVGIVLVFLASLVALLLRFTSFGLRVVAVRDHEAAASGLGLAAFRYRFLTFVLSSAIMGCGGALLAIQQVSFEPDGMFSISWTLNAVLMTIVGGVGTILGPLIGAVIVNYGLHQQLAEYQTLSLIVEGALLIAIVRFAPQGVGPLAVQAARRLRGFSLRRPHTANPAGG